MRSTASSELEKIRHRPRPVVLSEGEDPPDVTLTPEEYILEKEREQKVRDDAYLFDDRPLARIIYEGLINNFSAKTLRERTGLGKTAYESTLKLIKRRINKTTGLDG
jgi:hypothetical protein